MTQLIVMTMIQPSILVLRLEDGFVADCDGDSNLDDGDGFVVAIAIQMMGRLTKIVMASIRI